MIALIQRAKSGSVTIGGQKYSEIGQGMVILLGVIEKDTDSEIGKLVEKIINLRIFADQDGKMNLSILDTKGEILAVSQFTLAADLKKGRRPSFINAKEPVEAKRMYELFVEKLRNQGIEVKTGKFGADMHVAIVNDGPVTIIMDTNKLT